MVVVVWNHMYGNSRTKGNAVKAVQPSPASRVLAFSPGKVRQKGLGWYHMMMTMVGEYQMSICGSSWAVAAAVGQLGMTSAEEGATGRKELSEQPSCLMYFLNYYSRRMPNKCFFQIPVLCVYNQWPLEIGRMGVFSSECRYSWCQYCVSRQWIDGQNALWTKHIAVIGFHR